MCKWKGPSGRGNNGKREVNCNIVLSFTSWRQNPWLWRTTALLATTPSWSAREQEVNRLKLKSASRIVIILSDKYYSTYLFVGTFVSDRKLFLTERREARICAKGVTMRSSPWLQSKEKAQFIIDIWLSRSCIGRIRF